MTGESGRGTDLHGEGRQGSAPHSTESYGAERQTQAMDSTACSGDQPREALARVAGLLKQAHRALARSGVDTHTRAELTRRLLVITNVAKHDVATASRRLDAFLSGLSRDTSLVSGRDDDAPKGGSGRDVEPTDGRSCRRNG